MSFCKNHPDRDAIGKCIRCGISVCNECAANADGSMFCIACNTEVTQSGNEWISGPSPWEKSPYMDDQVQNYLRLGMLAGFFWIVTAMLSLIQYWMILFNPYEIFYQYYYISLIAGILNFLETLFLAIGFNGLFLKYSESACRYAVYANIMSLVTSSLSGFVYPIYGGSPYSILYLGSIFSVIALAILIITGYAFWRIRDSSQNPRLTQLASLFILGYFPVSVMVNIFLFYSTIYVFGIAIFSFITGIFVFLTFRAEKGMSPKTVISKW